MTTVNGQAGDDPSLCEELVRIVVRAEVLGFSRHRVATALRISTDQLQAIEQRHGLMGGSQPGYSAAR